MLGSTADDTLLPFYFLSVCFVDLRFFGVISVVELKELVG